MKNSAFAKTRHSRRTKNKFPTTPISGVDLFCGAGGLTHGLVRGGIQVNAGVDLDPHCRYPYEQNNQATFIEKDVRTLSGDELSAYFAKDSLRLIAGCAPCQPFSTYSLKARKIQQDDKWDLLLDFARLVNEIKPEFITMENVPQLKRHAVFQTFLASLSGYHLWFDVVDCIKYGVPQSRKRLVLLGSRLGKIAFIAPPTAHHKNKTVRDTISSLPTIHAGQKDLHDPLHSASSLSTLNLRRIRASKPGGTWRDWPESLRAKCHVKKSGYSYPSVYGRMRWDAPAPTMTTQCYGFGNGRFGHPEQDRAITLREAALFQTFPEHYQFIPPNQSVAFNALGRLIGNAVPVNLAEAIAMSFLEHLKTLNPCPKNY